MHWLGSGFKIGLNENLTKFREIQESTLILWLTHKQFSCFKHYFKGAINALLKAKKVRKLDESYIYLLGLLLGLAKPHGLSMYNTKKGSKVFFTYTHSSKVFCDLHILF